MARLKKSPHDPFRWFDSSPEVIRLVVMLYVRYPLSLRNVEDLHRPSPLVYRRRIMTPQLSGQS
jgi:transposase-like protein